MIHISKRVIRYVLCIRICFQIQYFFLIHIFLEYTEKDKKDKRDADEGESHATPCDWETLANAEPKFRPGASQYCTVKPEEFLKGQCTEANNFGFPDGSPCVLLKLNKV
jgi:hypothetical protein